MKVECIALKHPMDGTPLTSSPWLPVGQTYVVLSLTGVPDRHVSVRLICDDGNSIAVFESSQFKTVCNRLPTNWIGSIGDQGVLRLLPEKWARAGFWEAYFDGDAEAIQDFEIEKDKIHSEANEVPS